MDNNEIPPYDIPFDSNGDNNGTGIEPTISDNLLDIPLQEEENIENFGQEDSPEDLPEDMPGDSTEDFEKNLTEDNLNMETSMETQGKSEPPKRGGSILPLIGIVALLIIVLFGLLFFAFFDTIKDSIQNFSLNNNGKTEETRTLDLNNNDANNLDSLAENENSDTSNNLAEEENSEGTGIEITRGSRNTVQNTNQINNEENLPSLPGASNNSNNQIGNKSIYTNGNIGRLDPFNPISESGGELFDVIVPPVDPTPDPEAQALMSLRITGIMYTPEAPSAIINIAGQDQLVRRGDKFNGFNVEGITKDKVTVRSGINVYTASVGEILNIEQVGVNSIPNLNKKFAGPYSKGKDKIIEINMID